MTKFMFAQCIIFFAATASARVNFFQPAANSKNWMDNRIKFIIHNMEMVYEDAQTYSEDNLETITDRIEKYGRDPFFPRRNQFDVLMVNVMANANVACTQRLITGVESEAQDRINDVATCVEKFTETVRGTMDKIRIAVGEGLLQLNAYKNRADSCHSQGIPVIFNGFSTIRCLRNVELELYSAQKDRLTSRVQILMQSLVRVNADFDLCTGNLFDTNKRLASNLIPATRRCIIPTIPAIPGISTTPTIPTTSQPQPSNILFPLPDIN